MCFLLPASILTRQRISEFTEEQKSLKAKNDKRAFAILKQLAATQVVCSPDLSDYPHLQKALHERRGK